MIGHYGIHRQPTMVVQAVSLPCSWRVDFVFGKTLYEAMPKKEKDTERVSLMFYISFSALLLAFSQRTSFAKPSRSESTGDSYGT